jgi:hypothetical protein
MVVQMAISNPAEKLVMQTIQPAIENKVASNFSLKSYKNFSMERNSPFTTEGESI